MMEFKFTVVFEGIPEAINNLADAIRSVSAPAEKSIPAATTSAPRGRAKKDKAAETKAESDAKSADTAPVTTDDAANLANTANTATPAVTAPVQPVQPMQTPAQPVAPVTPAYPVQPAYTTPAVAVPSNYPPVPVAPVTPAVPVAGAQVQATLPVLQAPVGMGQPMYNAPVQPAYPAQPMQAPAPVPAPAPAPVPQQATQRKWTITDISNAGAQLCNMGPQMTDQLTALLNTKYRVESIMDLPESAFPQIASDLQAMGARMGG